MLDAKRNSESDADPFNEELLSPRRSSAQQGINVIAFVNHSAVCRSALQLVTRGVLGGNRCRQLTLAYCASNAYTTESMNGVLESLASNVSGMAVRTRLFSKQADQTVVDALQELVEQERPDLVVIASNSLPCIDQRTSSGASASPSGGKVAPGGPAAALSPNERSSAAQTLSMRLCQALRGVPLLVYKANTRGSFQEAAPGAPCAVKYMVDLQPTSRHMLDWLMGSLMDLKRDSLSLAVSKALEPNGTTKQMAVRMMTAFGVQASVNKLTPTKRLLREEAGKALPPAVVEEEVDVLLIQAPRSKDLSPYVCELLCTAPTSILIYPPESDSAALGIVAGQASDAPITRRVSCSTALPEEPTPATGRGRLYSADGAQPQVSSSVQAAMEAMQARQAARRKVVDTKTAAAMTSQRSGW